MEAAGGATLDRVRPKETRWVDRAKGALTLAGKAAIRAARGRKPKLTAACATTIRRAATSLYQ